MLKTEMQHQFWITKKTVQRKLGSKEDEHVISSDAELDSKIEIFKSIAETSTDLSKIIDQYQERLCILSQEESIFGRFLKEAGKRSKTTGQSISNTGKSVSYCGQQRMCVRVPLLRLQHEVDIYRNRAVSDTHNTIAAMEKERTEYRAALEWMKSSSSELDPDTGRGVDKFRTAQSHVRIAKQNFDCLSMDSIQKIDLLAAARCNMFSHVLVSYMLDMKQFAQKTTGAFETISKALEFKPRYDFCVLKELTQHENTQEDAANTNDPPFDRDQTLFFALDFEDVDSANKVVDSKMSTADVSNDLSLIELYQTDNIMDLIIGENTSETNRIQKDATEDGLAADKNHFWKVFGSKISTELNTQMSLAAVENAKNQSTSASSVCSRENSRRLKNSKQNSWVELFAELDPLGNLEAFDMQLSGGRKNFQQT